MLDCIIRSPCFQAKGIHLSNRTMQKSITILLYASIVPKSNLHNRYHDTYNSTMKNQKNTHKIHTMTRIGLLSALLCILGPLTIPIGPIPLSLFTLGLMLIVFLTNTKESLICCMLYLLLGLIGLPVFSGFSAGIGMIFGPTGGFLIGYLLLAFISSVLLSKLPDRHIFTGIAFLCGTILLYICGGLWLAVQAKLTFSQALSAGVIPFIPTDLIKILLIIWIGPSVKKRIPQ